MKDIEKYLDEGAAILFSQLDVFELAGILADERVSIKAKPGQVALQDIHIEPGATDMPAGPMISDFGNAGIKIAIENGKIVIKESKVLVRKGERISEGVAGILGKIEITPFTVGLEPIAAFDARTRKTYAGIKIDKHATLEDFRKAAANARAVALFISYPAREIINMLFAKANMQARAINSLIKPEAAEAQAEEKKENEQQTTEQAN